MKMKLEEKNVIAIKVVNLLAEEGCTYRDGVSILDSAEHILNFKRPDGMVGRIDKEDKTYGCWLKKSESPKETSEPFNN